MLLVALLTPVALLVLLVVAAALERAAFPTVEPDRGPGGEPGREGDGSEVVR